MENLSTVAGAWVADLRQAVSRVPVAARAMVGDEVGPLGRTQHAGKQPPDCQHGQSAARDMESG